jgi:Gpi18-like mannosyltransferase
MTVAGNTLGSTARLGGRTTAFVRGISDRRRRIAVAAVVVVAALCVRALFFKYQTGDYTAYFQTWYDFIKQHGGFDALRYSFANYNEPYLYLLAFLTYLPIGALTGIKIISVAFDLVLGYFSYRIVRLRYPRGWVPMIAASIILFLPTVVLNSSFWGQIDATYTSLGLGGLYFALRRRPGLACSFFGLALAFKLQIVFLLPVLLLLALRRWVPWRALVMVPVVFALADVPAFLVGASFSTLWSTYKGEVGLYRQLTLNAPNIYQYLHISESTIMRDVGIVFTLALVLGLVALVVVRRTELTPTRIVLASAVSVVLVPFFLPAMHERYFYLADALTVIAALYVPRRLWALPALEQFASLFSYLPFLLATTTTGTTSGALGKAFGSGTAPSGAGGGSAASGGGAQGPAYGPGSSGGLLGGGGGDGTFARGGSGGGGPSGAGHSLLSGAGQSAGNGLARPGSGVSGLSGHAVVSFDILSTSMLAALLLVVWVTLREFRDPRSARPGDATADAVGNAQPSPLA